MKSIILILLSILLCSCAGIRSRYYEVAAGDTLAGVAQHYDVPTAALKEMNAEVVKSGLHAGDKLYIPFEASPEWNQEFARSAETAEHDGAASDATRGISSVHFSWPVSGNISSLFGRRVRLHHATSHEGVDIAARQGTPVRAARSGHVIYASNRVRGYGNMVIVRHADNYSTVYAHLKTFKCKNGEFISRGAVLGLVGNTGRSRGAHLHFEIRDKQTPVDPLAFLPGQYAHHAVSHPVRASR